MKKLITINLDKEVLKELDKRVRSSVYNRSQYIEVVLSSNLGNSKYLKNR